MGSSKDDWAEVAFEILSHRIRLINRFTSRTPQCLVYRYLRLEYKELHRRMQEVNFDEQTMILDAPDGLEHRKFEIDELIQDAGGSQRKGILR